MKYFFDLEETLITDFDNPRIINRDKVKYLNYPVEVGVFSFAIWNEMDRIRFNSQIKPMIEDTFNVIVTEAPTMDEMVEVLKEKWTAIDDRDDIFDFFGKERTFVEYCRLMYPGEPCTLVDDQVPNAVYREGLVTGPEITTININELI